MSLQRGINLRALAEKMGQCSGAEVRGICTEAGMYALRERRQHVTQEDFEFAVAKACPFVIDFWYLLLSIIVGVEKEPRGKHFGQQTILVVPFVSVLCGIIIIFLSSLFETYILKV